MLETTTGGVVSTMECKSRVVHAYDSLYKTVLKDLVHLIATIVYSKLPEINIVMMDVEKQTNGSDCGVLSIAYAFDICSGFNPCVVMFDHSRIRQHLKIARGIARLLVSLYWVTERVSMESQ